MPNGWDPPKLEVDSTAESVFSAATAYTASSGKIETPSGDYEAIVGVSDTTGALGVLVVDFGTADQDDLPRLRMTSDQFDAAVDAIGNQKAAVTTLDPDSLITG